MRAGHLHIPVLGSGMSGTLNIFIAFHKRSRRHHLTWSPTSPKKTTPPDIRRYFIREQVVCICVLSAATCLFGLLAVSAPCLESRHLPPIRGRTSERHVALWRVASSEEVAKCELHSRA